MNAQIIVALIAALGAILGAAITFFLTKSKERSDQLRQRKQSQYHELLSAISGLADYNLTQAESQKKFAAAVNTIVLVAPQEVVNATMAYYRELLSNTSDRARRVELLKTLILEIRNSLELPFDDDPQGFDFELVATPKEQHSAEPTPRPRLDELGMRIKPAADWEDLVLPETQKSILREIVMHVRNRETVYESWGFAAKGERDLGVNAMFAGASGTGKTMAAEVLAQELGLDLYRIGLSSVVSKYIGETEKNLRSIFDKAEQDEMILLFDEADALFGKRSEVKDSHDRYTNIEVSYLLQRMNAYRGLAILTTNMKDALDPVFLRRLRFIVEFPLPGVEERAKIWQRTFPADTPTEELDAHKLAQLKIAGGSIRNIALNAAFLAADAGEPVRMTHILRCARHEYAKLEKPLTDAETRGWE